MNMNMNMNQDQLRAQWWVDLAGLSAQIDNLKARIETTSSMLHNILSTELAALQANLEKLKADVAIADKDVDLMRIVERIEELTSAGNAAYQLLQMRECTQLDPTEAEIRRLEAAATSASGEAKAKLNARIERLKTAQALGQAGTQRDEGTGQSGDKRD